MPSNTHEDNKRTLDKMSEMLEGELHEKHKRKDVARAMAMPTLAEAKVDAETKPKAGHRPPARPGLAEQVTSQYFARQEAEQAQQAEAAGMER